MVPSIINLLGEFPIVTYTTAGLDTPTEVPAPRTTRVRLAPSIRAACKSDAREQRTWGVVFIPHCNRTTIMQTRVNEQTDAREFLVRWVGANCRWKRNETWETREDGLRKIVDLRQIPPASYNSA